jgi:hypothetical protein
MSHDNTADDAPELTREQKAELLLAGIRAAGLDVDAELDRLGTLPAGESIRAMDDYQLLGLSARLDKLGLS